MVPTASVARHLQLWASFFLINANAEGTGISHDSPVTLKAGVLRSNSNTVLLHLNCERSVQLEKVNSHAENPYAVWCSHFLNSTWVVSLPSRIANYEGTGLRYKTDSSFLPCTCCS